MANDLPPHGSLVYGHWGEPKGDTNAAQAPVGSQPSMGGVPYIGPPDRAKKCTANDDTCNGWRMKGQDLCPMHAGVVVKRKAATDEPG